jgi:hypothetical protein
MIHAWMHVVFLRIFLSHDEVRLVADSVSSSSEEMPASPIPRRSLLYVLLKVADAMDNDKKRAQKNDEGKFYDNIKRGDSEASMR